MRACWLVGLLAACADGAADLQPDPVDWTDFSNQSTSQRITGTSDEIRIGLQASFKAGAPVIEYQLDDGTWSEFSPTKPTSAVVGAGTAIQFRVSGTVGDTGFITVSNVSMGDMLIDTVEGIVASPVSGDGSVDAPFVAPGQPPASCAAFLADHPEQAERDGIYRIEPSKPLDAYCDMTTDAGGWTLVARVIATSTNHVTANAVGLLTDPAQATTAKIDDATINTLGFTTARLALEATGSVYARVSTLDLSGTAFSSPNSAAPALAGPYTNTLVTSTTCGSDCGIVVVTTDMGFGRMCGYRYYASAGNPRDGMGCQGAAGKFGTVWVK